MGNQMYVLTQERKPYKHHSVWRKAWSTSLKKSGIDHCRFHDLRHTFVSNLIVNHKEDFATVMALSGHRDISMLKRYSHTREEAKRGAINKLNNPLHQVNVKPPYLGPPLELEFRTNPLMSCK